MRVVSVLILASLILSGCQSLTGLDPVEQYTIEEFLGTTSVRGSSFSPDGQKVLVSTDESGILNAAALSVDGEQSWPLTQSETESIGALAYFPDDERFLYSADTGGNELNHVFVQELDGSVRDLTPGENLKASFLGFAHDLTSFYVSTNERDARYFDLYEYQVSDYSRKLVYQNDDGYMLGPVSTDRRYLAVTQTITTSDSNVVLIDLSTGEARNLTEHGDEDVANSPQMFTRDGSKLYYSTDENSEFRYLASYDMKTGTKKPVLEYPWDVVFAGQSYSGKYLVVAVNQDASTRVHLYESQTLTPVPLPDFPQAEISSISMPRSEDRMAFYVNSSRDPSDLFVYDFASGNLTRLTENLNDAIDARHLVDGKVVRFSSYDGVEIPGILYRPHDASSTNKVPALVWVHGGPGGQSRIGYFGLIQYLVNHGYAIYAINNRGSSGYGKTFYKMDDRKHGEADLDDCIASKRMLIDTGYVDPDQIGIIGGSYGGYMVLAAQAFRPGEFQVGVDIFGVSNWLRTLESIPPWWEAFREALYVEMGHPVDDRDYLHRISPLFHASNIQTPLMVLQGANDPRVLQVESDEIVEAVRKNHVPVEYLVFEDEGHGFRKKENQHKGYSAILAFLDEYLKGEVEVMP